MAVPFLRPALLAALFLVFVSEAALAGQPTACRVDVAETLRRVNAARAAGQQCGWRRMPPAPPLRWNGNLQAAATGHSQDMARRNYFDHRSPEGRTVSERVRARHYPWKWVGENLAGGDRNIASAVQGWIDSPSHCENMMNPRFVDVAVACVGNPRSQWGTYWTMVLGKR
jgi:uncharacterized protein YkwD